jgi:signal transduction histidine kinase
MPQGGTIRIDTSEGDGQFLVTISDTGPGIPEHALPHLFTPFFTTKQVGQGTGLGLSVCYGIVKMHGGSISARNLPEGGARFDIAIRDPAPKTEAAAS